MNDEQQTLPDQAAETGPTRLRELFAALVRGQSGFNPWQPVHGRHQRLYTKAYADGRQKAGEAPAAALHPAPAPSKKAAARAQRRAELAALTPLERAIPAYRALRKAEQAVMALRELAQEGAAPAAPAEL